MKNNFTQKLLIVFVSMSIIQGINAQSLPDSEFDMDYLESLPEDVREDILKESKKMKEEERNNVKARPSSELLKLDIVKNWEEFQKKLEKKSERYGINLFRTMQSSFMPINEPNFGNNYIIDYGDILEIQTFNGNLKNTYSTEVKRDGSVNLDEIGPVIVSGLNFDQAVKLIKDKYKSSFIGSNVVVNLEKIRDIKILITGNVEFPGIYTLSGNSNILQALNIAGGVSENGSLRQIFLIRDDKKIEVDIYKALILGDISDLISLQSGDSINISPVKNLVRAGSGFNHEALFELKNNETLYDLVKYSGGIRNSVDNSKYTVVREENGQSVTQVLNESQLKNTLARNLDSIYLPVQNYGSVQITGEVHRPGIYTIYRQDDIYDLIKRAGGYTSDAYPFGGVLLNERAKELESDFLTKTYQSIISYIVQNPNQSQSNMNLPYLLNEIKSAEVSGRLVTEFDFIKLEDNPKDRTLLNDKDRIHIPKMENSVYVYGDVVNPSAIMYEDKLNVSDYLKRAGGLLLTASNEHIIVVAPDGSSQTFSKSIFKKNADNLIYPGSLIFIPKEVGKSTGINFYATAAPIFSSLALSIASLNSINN